MASCCFGNAGVRASCGKTRARTVRVYSARQSDTTHAFIPTVLAAAAASILTAHCAHAGVILEQPQLKKTFTVEETAAMQASEKKPLSFKPPGSDKPASSAAAAAAGEASKTAEESGSAFGVDVDPRVVALPGAAVALAGGWFLLSRIDPGFTSVLDKGALKDSSEFGVGYEQALQDGRALTNKRTASKTSGKRTGQTGSSTAGKARSTGSGIFGTGDRA